ncbi:hypothetical protein [Chitinophaga caseinilytica]|uniref:hypothetical protein n=1 Tax=Chitinophaga caseinilytica TaxID=2267521 RepID=UPI003C2CE4B1
MSTSYIEYKERGFWENDIIVEIMSAYLLCFLQKIEDKPSWLIEFQELVKYNSKGYYIGWMHFDLDEYLTTAERREKLVDILHSLRNQLDNNSDMLDLSELNVLYETDSDKAEYQGTISKQKVIEVINKFIMLIRELNIE